MNAILTGSHAYGTTTPESDVDLVVLVDAETKDKLLAIGGLPCRFGDLNLIPVTTQNELDCWKEATRRCIELADSRLFTLPFTRDDALEIHKACREEFGVSLHLDPSKPKLADNTTLFLG